MIEYIRGSDATCEGAINQFYIQNTGRKGLGIGLKIILSVFVFVLFFSSRNEQSTEGSSSLFLNAAQSFEEHYS